MTEGLNFIVCWDVARRRLVLHPVGSLNTGSRLEIVGIHVDTATTDEWRTLLDAVTALVQTSPPCGCGTGADYRFDPNCLHHSGLRAAALARLQSTEPTP